MDTAAPATILLDAMNRLGEAIRLLSLIDMQKRKAKPSQNEKEENYLADMAELTVHRDVIATVRALRTTKVPLPLDDFESVYLNLLSDIYADPEKALLQADDQPRWLLINPAAAAERRPFVLANLASLVAAISTQLPDSRAATLRTAPPTTETACATSTLLSADVAAWVRSQPSVGEESITDWFLYRLSDSVPWVRYLPFTRREEGTRTGADWEWWLIGDSRSLGMRVQAKNFARAADAYPLLAYANRRGLQIEMLMEAAAQNKLLPLFALYHGDSRVGTTLCPGWTSHAPGDQGVFLADAERCYSNYVKPGRRRVDPLEVLSQSCSLACLFCCSAVSDASLVGIDDILAYIRSSLRQTNQASLPGIWESPPPHVAALLEALRAEPPHWIETEFASRLLGVSALVAFDFRGAATRA